MELTIDKNVYSDSCITKAVYSLADHYVVNRSTNGTLETLDIQSISPNKSDNDIKKAFLSALNDYKLRQIVADETHEIRVILYAKAFADYEDLSDEGL